MPYKGDICNIMLLIALIMLRTRTLENGRFSPTLVQLCVNLIRVSIPTFAPYKSN